MSVGLNARSSSDKRRNIATPGRLDAVLGHGRNGLRLNFGLAVQQQQSFSIASGLRNTRGGIATTADSSEQLSTSQSQSQGISLSQGTASQGGLQSQSENFSTSQLSPDLLASYGYGGGGGGMGGIGKQQSADHRGGAPSVAVAGAKSCLSSQGSQNLASISTVYGGRRARHLSRERGRNPSRSEGRGSRELSAGISLDKEAAGEMFEQFLSQKFRTQVLSEMSELRAMVETTLGAVTEKAKGSQQMLAEMRELRQTLNSTYAAIGTVGETSNKVVRLIEQVQDTLPSVGNLVRDSEDHFSAATSGAIAAIVAATVEIQAGRRESADREAARAAREFQSGESPEESEKPFCRYVGEQTGRTLSGANDDRDPAEASGSFDNSRVGLLGRGRSSTEGSKLPSSEARPTGDNWEQAKTINAFLHKDGDDGGRYGWEAGRGRAGTTDMDVHAETENRREISLLRSSSTRMDYEKQSKRRELRGGSCGRDDNIPEWRAEDSRRCTHPSGPQMTPHGRGRPFSAPTGGHDRSPASAGPQVNDQDTPPTPRQGNSKTRSRASAASDSFNPFDEEPARMSSWSRAVTGWADESPVYLADSVSEKRKSTRSRVFSGPSTQAEDGEHSTCGTPRSTTPAARETAPARGRSAATEKTLEIMPGKPNTDSHNDYKTRNGSRPSLSVDAGAGKSSPSPPLRYEQMASSAMPAAPERHELPCTRSQSAARRVKPQTKESAPCRFESEVKSTASSTVVSMRHRSTPTSIPTSSRDFKSPARRAARGTSSEGPQRPTPQKQRVVEVGLGRRSKEYSVGGAEALSVEAYLAKQRPTKQSGSKAMSMVATQVRGAGNPAETDSNRPKRKAKTAGRDTTYGQSRSSTAHHKASAELDGKGSAKRKRSNHTAISAGKNVWGGGGSAW